MADTDQDEDQNLESQESSEEEDESSEEQDDTEDSDGDPDYKALYEAEKVKAEKAEGDRRSARGALKSQQERDDILYNLGDEVTALRGSLKLLVEGIGKDDVSGLTEQMAEVDNAAAQTRTNRTFEAQYASAYETLKEALTDEDGATVIDPKSPEMAEFIADWNEAHGKKDLTAIFMLTTDIQKERRQLDRQRGQTDSTEAEKKEKAVKRAARQKKGSQDLGPATGGGNSTERTALDKIESGLKKRHDIVVAKN